MPEVFLPKLLREKGEHALVYQQEICKEEQDVEYYVEEALKKKTRGIKFERVWGSTIYHIDDLPMDPAEIAPQYTKFR
jgi:deoxyribodipyrimidine photo-lyase